MRKQRPTNRLLADGIGGRGFHTAKAVTEEIEDFRGCMAKVVVKNIFILKNKGENENECISYQLWQFISEISVN